MARLLCSRCGHKQDFQEQPVDGRPADEFELFQQAHSLFRWQFQLTSPRRMYCRTCYPKARAERDALTPVPLPPTEDQGQTEQARLL